MKRTTTLSLVALLSITLSATPSVADDDPTNPCNQNVTMSAGPEELVFDCIDWAQGVASYAQQKAEACIDEEPESDCEPVYRCLEPDSGSVCDPAHEEADRWKDEAEGCLEPGSGSACDPVHEEADEARRQAIWCVGGDPTSPCYVVTQYPWYVYRCLTNPSTQGICQTVYGCIDGNPAFPCDPDPSVQQPHLTGCVEECVTETYRQPVDVDVTIENPHLATVPDAYLVLCRYGNPSVPVVTLNDEESCPLGGEYQETIMPLVQGWEQDRPHPVIDPVEDPAIDLLSVTSGNCHLTFEATVYGIGWNEDPPTPVPCAFVEPHV